MQLSDQVRAFLAEPRFTVAATIGEDGVPQQTVLWYDLQGDEIMMNTTEERVKTGNLRRDPRLSLCMEDGYRYVTLTGRVTLIADQETAQADIARLARRYHSAEQAERQIAQFRKQRRVTIRLSIEHVVPYGFSK